MKYALSVLLVIASFGDLDRIAKINQLKKEAKQAYQEGDFSQAISKYHYLLDSMKVEDERIRLNLANAYYQSNDTTNALNNYGSVTESNLNVIKSTAYQQTGIIQHQQKKHKEALESFKQAIKSDPTNEEARYNYEMLKKFLKEQEKNQDQDQQKQDKDNKDKQDQENKDQKNEDKKDQDKKDQDKKDQEKQDQEQKDQEKQDKEGEDKEKKEGEEKEQEEKEGEEKDKKEEEAKEGEEKEDQKNPEEMPEGADQKMKEMKITEEKAKMILEALKNQEVQYIQQNRKKAKKRPKSNKPDW